MIFDNTLLLSNQQAITATAASTNVIDLGATGTPYGGVAVTRDIGAGREVDLSVLVVQDFATCTSVQVVVQTSPDNSAWTDAYMSRAIPVATLVAGYQVKVPNSFELGVNARYVRLNYVVAGSNATTGKITAGVVSARQTNSGMSVAV